MFRRAGVADVDVFGVTPSHGSLLDAVHQPLGFGEIHEDRGGTSTLPGGRVCSGVYDEAASLASCGHFEAL